MFDDPRLRDQIRDGAFGVQVVAAIGPVELGREGVESVLKLVALAAAAVSAAPNPALVSTAPWWETVTVTIGGDGQAQGCEYRTSSLPGAKACDVDAPGGAGESGGAKDQYTRLTFERRFRPAGEGLTDDQLPSGDTLIGRQVLALAIGADGAVSGCRVVAKTGDMTPEYGCEEAAAEKFEAAARSGAGTAARQGYMSILVYGHSEHIV